MAPQWPCVALAAFLIGALAYKSISGGSSALPRRIVTAAGPLAPAPTTIVPEELVAPLSPVGTAEPTGTDLVARASSPPSSLMPPSPPLPNPRVRWCEHLARPEECEWWFSQQQLAARSVVTPRVRLPARSCTENCHGRGVCDPLLGVCNCYVGWNGTSCEGRSLRTCNGGSHDGLWMQSHCAGECDESRGWCWCPGKVGVRPMPDSCQVGRMPLSVFAALELRPGPDSSGEWLNGSAAVAPAPGALGRLERQRRSERLVALSRLMLQEPKRRTRLLRRWWFGRGERGWRVEVNVEGVPHAVRRAPRAGATGAASAASSAAVAAAGGGGTGGDGGGGGEEGAGRGEGDAAAAPLFEKLSARRKWKARELLASPGRGEAAAQLRGGGLLAAPQLSSPGRLGRTHLGAGLLCALERRA